VPRALAEIFAAKARHEAARDRESFDESHARALRANESAFAASALSKSDKCGMLGKV
jgi:hypothetical protein